MHVVNQGAMEVCADSYEYEEGMGDTQELAQGLTSSSQANPPPQGNHDVDDTSQPWDGLVNKYVLACIGAAHLSPAAFSCCAYA